MSLHPLRKINTSFLREYGGDLRDLARVFRGSRFVTTRLHARAWNWPYRAFGFLGIRGNPSKGERMAEEGVRNYRGNTDIKSHKVVLASEKCLARLPLLFPLTNRNFQFPIIFGKKGQNALSRCFFLFLVLLVLFSSTYRYTCNFVVLLLGYYNGEILFATSCRRTCFVCALSVIR